MCFVNLCIMGLCITALECNLRNSLQRHIIHKLTHEIATHAATCVFVLLIFIIYFTSIRLAGADAMRTLH